MTPENRPLPVAHQWSAAEGGEVVSSPTGSNSSNSSRKLTRKKWLETSEGGLLFGSPQLYQGQDSDSEHEVHRPSRSASVRRLLPRTPQTEADTIARQPVVRACRSNVFVNVLIATLLLLFQDIKEKVELRMRAIADAEKRIDELQKEKHQVWGSGNVFCCNLVM